eukprot:SAG31_NODE_7532_length_1663_cov_1.397059_1_plen_46_part_10
MIRRISTARIINKFSILPMRHATHGHMHMQSNTINTRVRTVRNSTV